MGPDADPTGARRRGARRRRGGIEAPVALHVANNLLWTTVNALMAGGGTIAVHRSVGSGDAFLLIPAAVGVGMVVLVGVRERRARQVSSDGSVHRLD